MGLRGNFGYAWSGYSRALVRSGFQWVPATPEWNSFTVGVLAEHRFVFRGVGDSDQGLAAFISYDARVWPAFSRVEHLITVMVSIGR